MAYQPLNNGSTANDGSGDSLRDAAGKINGNFEQLFSTRFVTTFTADSAATNNHGVILADTSTASINISIPTAFDNSGKVFTVKKTAAANTVTLDPFSAQTIDGAATKVLSTQWESVTIISDGANWIDV